jgi:hypothetical protein
MYVTRNPVQNESIVAAAWLSSEEMQGKLIYPPVLSSDYWTDKQNRFQQTRYLGVRATDL